MNSAFLPGGEKKKRKRRKKPKNICASVRLKVEPTF